MNYHLVLKVSLFSVCCLLVSTSQAVVTKIQSSDKLVLKQTTVKSSPIKKEADKTLGSIVSSTSTSRLTPLDAPSLNKLVADYKHLVTMTNDTQIREKIDYRLAQLLSQQSEYHQEVGTNLPQSATGYYDEAITAFNRWLARYPKSTLTSDVMYELAKVYELQGQSQLSYQALKDLIQQFPQTKFANEAYFRQGEYLFSKQRYQLAANAYQYIIDNANEKGEFDSPFFQTALYMAGWTQYKLDNHKQSLALFSEVLDRNLPRKSSSNLTIDKLPLANKQLVTDAFKVMNLIFSNGQGPISLAQFYASIGGRYFEYLHVDSMAQEFLANKRYRDSANTYDIFVNNYPQHHLSPQFSINKVTIYTQGNFPTQVKLEKEQFVNTYGYTGNYWRSWNVQRQNKYAPTLKEYLSEMAQDQYRLAQQTVNKSLKVTLFSKAAELLLQYQQTFNDDQALAFLYAESLYASKQWRLAINAYNEFAYGTTQTFERSAHKRADAAYNAVLTFRDLSPSKIMPNPVVDTTGQLVLSEHEESAVRFTHKFSDDERSKSILLSLMNHRFSQARYDETIEVVQRILTWPNPIKDSHIINAKLIKAHSIYNQARFQLAIVAYEDVVTLLKDSDKRLTVIHNNLAASLFNYAEQLAASSDLNKAADYYQQVLTKTPKSPIRKVAHYNWAQSLYKLNKLDEAVTQLLAFKSRYKKDELADDIDVQLASIYVQQQDWNQAARQRLALANNMPKSIAQQEALYLIATFYEKAQDEANALKTYRRHANTYQKPVSRYLEVMNKITEKYMVINEARKYRFWLKKIIKVHDSAGKNATPRSTYLAAQSALVFAKDAKRQFDQIKLNLPLNKSLVAKKKSLAKTLTAYKKVSDYRVASFTTQSTFETAQVYRQLAQDLMASERPKGLDELALEQYDILLEEQAYPFEDQAIALFENNAKLSWKGLFDSWIDQSFQRLSHLLPGRYNKVEKIDENVNIIY